ncbi:hypothetical protein MKZ38_005316 [Zalerion maritima]|uniref:Uncharacterized protein n=1 Tax=Zalerion maritima TaxID=339359 RepID=A0AAD5WPC1_9PEZI|nr:hypothetical protein MKZ38_005316 [Zalerion maritima]
MASARSSYTSSSFSYKSSSDSAESGSTYQTSASSAKSRKYMDDEGSHAYAPCYAPEEDVSPSTSINPRASVDTYSSDMSDDEVDEAELEDCYTDDEASSIPPLPAYRGEASEPYVRPSNPADFSRLYPTLTRLSIRHDEYTTDGNLNLRVDTTVNAPGHRRVAMQLFHLRMYDLAKREFSLRRYCRDSGREVCNSKRKYQEPGTTAEGRPTFQRSVSSALKTLGSRPQFRRGGSNASSVAKRPGTSSSSYEADEDIRQFSRASSLEINPHHRPAQPQRPVATNSIKLEFSNYARVDITRQGSSGGRGKKSTKRYGFQWWGHKYSWRRHVDRALGTVSFHLLRDNDTGMPVAHIVPETRTPTQVHADEAAGGWVPPCHMWISDESVLEAMTDVADVIMATGLMALVDDCIKERWQTKKPTRIAMPGRSSTLTSASSKSFGMNLFHRRNSDHPSPLRIGGPVAAY